jgi:hypothetical protein
MHIGATRTAGNSSAAWAFNSSAARFTLSAVHGDRFACDIAVFSSWPDLFRPSTSCRRREKDVDARHKAGHDDPEVSKGAIAQGRDANHLTCGSSS